MKVSKTDKLLSILIKLQAAQLLLLATDAKTPHLGQAAMSTANEAVQATEQIMGTTEKKDDSV